METPNYPSNSKSTPATPKTAEKIVTGEVTRRPKSLGKRLKDALIGGDSRSALQYVFAEVVIPQAKDMIAEAVTTAFEKFIFGESRSGHRRSSNRSHSSGYTNYTNRYTGRGTRTIGGSRREENIVLRKSHDLDDLIFETRADAQAVLEEMYDRLEQYDTVSVAELMTMIDNPSTHTDQKWGWESLDGSEIRTIAREGYLLILPKPIPLV